jgi:hypothetical protein
MHNYTLVYTSTTPKGNGCGIIVAWRIVNLTDPHQIALVAPILLKLKK